MHAHQLMPKHGVQNKTRTKPELWFAAKSQYFLYDQSSHLEAKLTCTTAIGRQAGRQAVEEILLFVGKRKGVNRPVQGGFKNLFISEGSKENQ
jgi:hypothetical protein